MAGGRRRSAPCVPASPAGIRCGACSRARTRPSSTGRASRWVPVVTAYDRYGRVRGTVGAVLLHYDGLCGSSRWVYFGADNVDLDGGRENADHFNAWARECLNGFAESGRRYLVTAEVSGEDMHRDIFRALDFVSISCYHRYAENPVQVRLREMRAIGKSFTNAEFGRQASSSTPADHHSPAGRQAVACRDIGRVPCRTTSTGASCRRRSRCRS